MNRSVFYNGKIAVPGGFVEGMAIEGQNIVRLGSSEEVCAIQIGRASCRERVFLTV